MASAKDIVVKPIKASAANDLVKRVHYSGKVDPRSQLHLGVFLLGRLEGVMQFGPSIQKSNIMPLVEGTSWNGFIELNRMAFSDALPRNSESRALSVAMRIIRKHYPHIEWVVSFSDGTQCGDGVIYRASGFFLTAIKKNTSMWRMPSGEVVADIVTRMKSTGVKKRIGYKTGEPWSKFTKRVGAEKLIGFQLRYIYFLNKEAKKRLTVPILPFSKIDEMGAGMYKGEKITRTKDQELEHPSSLGGETPTRALQTEGVRHGR